jgi:hypothetical protein
MKQQEPVSRSPQDCTYSDTVGQQAAAHAEAHRRLSNGAPTSLTGLDSWSSSGDLPGRMTPDVVNQETVGFGVTSVPTLAPEDIPQNTESIFRNAHMPGGRREK